MKFSLSPLVANYSKAALCILASCGLVMTSCSSGPKMPKNSVAGEQARVEPAPAEQKTLVDYEVKQGDTLWDLAREHDTTVSEIKAINKMEGDVIMWGKTIKLPVSKVLEPGETPYVGMDPNNPTEPLAAQPESLVPKPIVPTY